MLEVQPVQLDLQGGGLCSFLGKLLIETAVLVGHLVAFGLEFGQLGFSVFYVLVGLNKVKFELLVELFILVSLLDQLLTGFGEHVRQLFYLACHRGSHLLYFRIILSLYRFNLIFVHLFDFGCFTVVSAFFWFISCCLKSGVCLRWIIVVVCVGACFFINDLL